ncbi:MAG: hypothetical protein CL902_00365 [Dehalococcoidia bacterium]|nr:hypothetical protein [Dehalococcoidia bacterium]
MSSAFPKLKDTRKKPDKGESRNVRTMSTPKVKVDNPKGKGKISLPKKYVPKSLSAADKKKQVKSIVEGKKRPKVESFKSKRSTHATAFEKKYGFKISDKRVNQIISPAGQKQILDKGRAAYYTGGSRPNQTPESWARARLASVIMGGKARKVDQKIWDKYKKT